MQLLQTDKIVGIVTEDGRRVPFAYGVREGGFFSYNIQVLYKDDTGAWKGFGLPEDISPNQGVILTDETMMLYVINRWCENINTAIREKWDLFSGGNTEPTEDDELTPFREFMDAHLSFEDNQFKVVE